MARFTRRATLAALGTSAAMSLGYALRGAVGSPVLSIRLADGGGTSMLGMMNTMVIGVCEYRISDKETDVIDAQWISSDAMDRLDGAICSGRARGDTSNGFPGDYHVQYFDAEGELTGDLDLHIEPVGQSYGLTWRNRAENAGLPAASGEVVFEGIGFPSGDKSMILAYWMAETSSRISLNAR
jgi:hypothetical protein